MSRPGTNCSQLGTHWQLYLLTRGKFQDCRPARGVHGFQCGCPFQDLLTGAAHPYNGSRGAIVTRCPFLTLVLRACFVLRYSCFGFRAPGTKGSHQEGTGSASISIPRRGSPPGRPHRKLMPARFSLASVRPVRTEAPVVALFRRRTLSIPGSRRSASFVGSLWGLSAPSDTQDY